MSKPWLSLPIRGVFAVGLCAAAILGADVCRADDEHSDDKLDVPFEGTPAPVAEAMLRLAEVTEKDVVYDLGCGDGRILIMAAKKFGAEGYGVDIDPQRLKEANENATSEGVADRVHVSNQDIFQTDVSKASVVTLYLLDEINVKLRPTLFRQLKPGSRVVTHAFTMGDWECDQMVKHPRARDKQIFLWIIPAAAGGSWDWTTKTPKGDVRLRLFLRQDYQKLSGTLVMPDHPENRCGVGDVELTGRQITFSCIATIGGKQVRIECRGEVDGDAIQGTQEWKGDDHSGGYAWTARRTPVNPAGRWRVTTERKERKLDGLLEIPSTGPGSFTFDDGGRKAAISALYLWGSSVRCEIAQEEGAPLVLKGVFGEKTASGTATKEEWNGEAPWTAKRE